MRHRAVPDPLAADVIAATLDRLRERIEARRVLEARERELAAELAEVERLVAQHEGRR